MDAHADAVDVSVFALHLGVGLAVLRSWALVRQRHGCWRGHDWGCAVYVQTNWRLFCGGL